MQQGVEGLSGWHIQCRAREKRLSMLIRCYTRRSFAGSGRAVTPALCIDCRTEGVEQVDGKVNTGWRLQQVAGQCGEVQVVVQHQWTGWRSWALGVVGKLGYSSKAAATKQSRWVRHTRRAQSAWARLQLA